MNTSVVAPTTDVRRDGAAVVGYGFGSIGFAKPGGHGERGVAVGALDMAQWDATAKIAGIPLAHVRSRAFAGAEAALLGRLFQRGVDPGVQRSSAPFCTESSQRYPSGS